MADAAPATPSATPSLSDVLSGYQGRLTGHANEVKAAIDTAKGAFEARMAKADTEEAALNPNALTPPTLTPPPTPKATQPVEEWGSAAMAIAALGGLLTRRPLTNALNAMGGVLNAYRQMDATAAQHAYDVWKVETENAVKLAQFTLDSYKTALSRIQDDRKAASSDFLATARALGDENAAYVAEHYGMDAVVRYVGNMQAHIDRMDKVQTDLDKKNTELQLYMKVNDARTALADAQKKGNPQAIAAARAALQTAMQAVIDFRSVYGGSGRSGSSPEAVQLKDFFDKAYSHYNVVSNNPTSTKKDIEDARQVMEKARQAWENATGGGGVGTEPPIPPPPHVNTVPGSEEAELQALPDNATTAQRNAIISKYPPAPIKAHDPQKENIAPGTTSSKYPGWIVREVGGVKKWVYEGH